MTALFAGLAFGLVGSAHCATMCGPLVMLANPRGAGLGTHPACSQRRIAGHAALYHGARASMYVALGAIVGLAGGALTHMGFGRALAVFAGVALVLQAVSAAGIVHGRLGSPTLGNVVSRRYESEADWSALRTTHDPAAAASVFRKFARYDLVQPNPPLWSYIWIDDHPTVVQRIAMARAYAARRH